MAARLKLPLEIDAVGRGERPSMLTLSPIQRHDVELLSSAGPAEPLEDIGVLQGRHRVAVRCQARRSFWDGSLKR